MSRIVAVAVGTIAIGSALVVSTGAVAGADDEPVKEAVPECVVDGLITLDSSEPDVIIDASATEGDGDITAVPDCVRADTSEPQPQPVVDPVPEPAVDEQPQAVVEVVPAQLSDPVAPITDYLNYPDGLATPIFDATCTPHDGRILLGLLFTDDDESSDRFRTLTLHNNEEVTMTWTGFRAGCETTMVSLSVKRADVPFFDVNENQELDEESWVYCGTTQTPCTKNASDRYSLTITMPPLRRACSWQADATYGPPLAVVGPDGSYYSSDVRSDTGKPYPTGSEMLVQAPGGGANEAANNGGRTCTGRQPHAEVRPVCGPGGFTIDLTNDGDIESEFEITVDGVLFEQIPVAPLEPASRPIPAAEDSTHHVLVTAETGTNPPTITTLFDDDVVVDCEDAPPPTVTLTASADCANDAPYLNYEATPANASPASVTLHWFDANNVERLTQADVPTSGRVPYPGVVLDSQGNPTDWPGWVRDADGRWVEGADGFEWVRPTITLTASFNPTSDPVTVAIPPGDPDCHPSNPPVSQRREGLPRTGAESGRFAALGFLLVGLGSLLLLAGNRQRRSHPAWRHLAR